MVIYIYIYGQGPHHVPLYIWSRRSYRTRRTQSQSYGGRTAVYAMDDAVAQLSHESIPLVFSPLRAASNLDGSGLQRLADGRHSQIASRVSSSARQTGTNVCLPPMV